MNLSFYATISLLFVLLQSENIFADEAPPGFFLKVSKHIPRLGRRSAGFSESSFLTNLKNMPRIGREFADSSGSSKEDTIENFKNPYSKRLLGQPIYDLSAYTTILPVDSNILNLLSRDMIPSDKLKFISWRDLDYALSRDEELYSKLMSVSKDVSTDVISLYNNAYKSNSLNGKFYGNDLAYNNFNSDDLYSFNEHF